MARECVTHHYCACAEETMTRQGEQIEALTNQALERTSEKIAALEDALVLAREVVALRKEVIELRARRIADLEAQIEWAQSNIDRLGRLLPAEGSDSDG
jgi:predicted RNase H-like nuclease (RuvC/YqgF family)